MPTEADFTPAALAERQHVTAGLPPRVPSLKPEELGADAMAAMNTARAAINLPPLVDPDPYTSMMLRNPGLFQAQMTMGVFLFQGTLSVRHREIAIVRIGWLARAPFEFGEHVRMSKRLAGITDAEIERILIGSTAEGWSFEDRAILKAVEECLADSRIGDATWEELATFLDYPQQLELPLMIGTYLATAFLQNTIRAELLPGNEGLMMR
jgi:alkylhydroperoxidase family enzyme